MLHLSPYVAIIVVVKRKPVLIVDESDDSMKAIDLLKRLDIEYVEYDNYYSVDRFFYRL